MTEPQNNEFETSFRRLESIVEKLEQEELSLDESLALFEEGVKLSRLCHGRLDKIEKKIETILADAKGEPVTENFDSEEQ